MGLYARFQLVGETETEVEYLVGNDTAMDQTLVMNKETFHVMPERSVVNVVTLASGGKIMREFKARGRWPTAGAVFS